jgi:hypothetical protein
VVWCLHTRWGAPAARYAVTLNYRHGIKSTSISDPLKSAEQRRAGDQAANADDPNAGIQQAAAG